MKKYKETAAFLSLVVVLLLAACSNQAEEVAAMEGEVRKEADDSSASELFIDSLGYFLQEDGTEDAFNDGALGAAEDQTAKEDVAEEQKEAQQAEVMIYYGNGASDELSAETSFMEQVTAENLVDALSRHNIVSLGTKVNSFEEEEADGKKTLRLDLSKSFYEYLKTMTKEGEKIIMYSVAATFMEAYDADGIFITVDGKILKTEHATYEEPIHYTPGQLKALEGE